MRVLVTGACGHIGSALIRAWPSADLTLLDNLSTQRYASLFDLPHSVRFIEGDVLDAVLLERLVPEQDVVVHLAALTDAEASIGRQDAYFRVNCGGTLAVAEACLAAGVPLVFVSTTSVYGPQSGIVDEMLAYDQYNPQTPYADSKHAAEHALTEYLGPRGLRWIILRFGTIYGPSRGMRFHTAVNKWCWQAAWGQPLTVYRGAWDSARPYLGLRDAVDAIRWAAKQDGSWGQTCNVVTGHHTPREVVDAIRYFLPDTQTREVDVPQLNQRGYTVATCHPPDRRPPDGTYDLFGGVGDTLRMLVPDILSFVPQMSPTPCAAGTSIGASLYIDT